MASPPTALVDTVEPDGRARCWLLQAPVETWEARSLGEVVPALERVEVAQKDGLTVAGGLRYEAAGAFDPALVTWAPGGEPLAFFAAYDHVSRDLPPAPHGTLRPRTAPRPRVARERFVEQVRAILERIAAGDVYQVNLTLRAEIPAAPTSAGDAWALHLDLRDATRAPHAAYLAWAPSQVLSLSPELFLRRRGSRVESAPMKGTAPRSTDPVRDAETRDWLAGDAKTRAENLMIVDLMRNDLGRVCRPGTVTVPRMWTVAAHPTVFQMTSLVRGELRPGVGLADILAATFPPGSVTGAPKVRAMQIIRELEADPRGIYCGVLGVFHPGGDLDLNVAIRTIEASPSGPALLGLGAGIVADSDPWAEWEETLLKGRFLNLEPFLSSCVVEGVSGLTRRIP